MGKVTAIISTAALLAPIIALTTIVPGIGSEAALPYSVVFGLLAYGVGRLTSAPISMACCFLVIAFEVARLKYYGLEFLDLKAAGVIGGLLGVAIGAIWSKWPKALEPLRLELTRRSWNLPAVLNRKRGNHDRLSRTG